MDNAAYGIEGRCTQLRAALNSARPPQRPALALIESAIDAAQAALQVARSELSVALLEVLVELAPHVARAWRLLGFAYGAQQRIPDAARVLARAALLEPLDARTAAAHARAALDSGLPAAALFEHAHRLSPDELSTVGGWAAALVAEGNQAAGETLLADALRRHPDWIAGHASLSALRFTRGESDFARGYAEACADQPHNLPLRLAWFGALAQARKWDRALQLLADGERLIGAVPAFAAARAILAGESGDTVRAEALFAQIEPQRDEAVRMAHLRHCLRTGQPDKAERLALGLMEGPMAPAVWPYLSLIWRLRGDARAQWLDGAPPCIRVFDLAFQPGELAGLAEVLRKVHTARGPFAEQSVRGGTQTDTHRQLFFRAEPEIQAVRAKVGEAVREYVAGLPEPVPGHPLLGTRRNPIRFSGSWSVRLTGGGFHVAHTHPMGWISSALYVALPAQLGAAPAGWIRFGVPPASLGLSLPPYLSCEPRPGRLILFPSTMWHETVSFDDGERLVVAFDVMTPAAPRAS